MANRTVTDAKSVKGTNPQYLVEKIVRTRIYECKYWKEQCFALSGKLSCGNPSRFYFFNTIYDYKFEKQTTIKMF